MPVRFTKRAVTRLFSAFGLARAVEVEQERHRRVRVEQRILADAAKLSAAHERIRQTKERASTLHVQLRDRRHKLNWLEDRLLQLQEALGASRDYGKRMDALHGEAGSALMRQLSIKADALSSLSLTPAVATAAATLEAVAPDYVSAQAAWLASGAPDGSRHVRIGNLDWYVPPDATDDGSLSHRILERQSLPLDDVALVRQFVVGGVMLDIGANIGTTSIPRVVLGDFARVYAAEPNSDNYRCLVASVLANRLAGRVLPDRVAISSTSGTVRLKRTRKIGSHRLLLDAAPSDSESEAVACFTADDWIGRLQVDPGVVTFVKVDTQGWDLHVLQGARTLLARRDVVWQIEASPSMLKRAGSSVQDLCALVAQHFTHVREMGSRAAQRQARAADLAELLVTGTAERRFVNLLLFNLQ